MGLIPSCPCGAEGSRGLLRPWICSFQTASAQRRISDAVEPSHIRQGFPWVALRVCPPCLDRVILHPP